LVAGALEPGPEVGAHLPFAPHNENGRAAAYTGIRHSDPLLLARLAHDTAEQFLHVLGIQAGCPGAGSAIRYQIFLAGRVNHRHVVCFFYGYDLFHDRLALRQQSNHFTIDDIDLFPQFFELFFDFRFLVHLVSCSLWPGNDSTLKKA
jgi:hypothetical protein